MGLFPYRTYIFTVIKNRNEESQSCMYHTNRFSKTFYNNAVTLWYDSNKHNNLHSPLFHTREKEKGAPFLP